MSIGFKVAHKESTEVTPAIEQQIFEDSFGEPSKMAHIVMAPMGRFRKNKRKKSPQAMVLEARVKGTPLTALCGYTWVPSQNPEHLPKCAKCVLIYQTQHLRNEKDRRLPDA